MKPGNPPHSRNQQLNKEIEFLLQNQNSGCP
jgi:hypothetical protein